MTTNGAALPDVLGLLPHRYPFLLLDRITVVEPGRRAAGLKRVTADEWFFGGPLSDTVAARHDRPMPNALIIEALAQLSAALLIGLRDGIAGPMVGYFMGIDRVRYRGEARPGDEIQLMVELVHFRRGILRTRGEAWVDGHRIVRAELMTALRVAPAEMTRPGAAPLA